MSRDTKILLGLGKRLIRLLDEHTDIFFKERPRLENLGPLKTKEELETIRAECVIERKQCNLEIKKVCEAIEKLAGKEREDYEKDYIKSISSVELF